MHSEDTVQHRAVIDAVRWIAQDIKHVQAMVSEESEKGSKDGELQCKRQKSHERQQLARPPRQLEVWKRDRGEWRQMRGGSKTRPTT